jgi:coenzyme F420-reducing hydrogenase beta subunit
MNNILELSGKCYGCSACAVLCPVKAISMVKNEEGFFYPTVNENVCLSCGICKKVCDKEKPFFEKTQHKKTLALQSSDIKNLKESSSGGIASSLSEYFVKNGGYVLGAYFDLANNIVETKVTNKASDLELFKTSKYLQAYFFTGLSEAIQIAREDKKAVFLIFGTPCQIKGAYNICNFYNVLERFIFVDFFCHGVPSYLAWNAYLADKKISRDDLKYVSFRTKKNGWHSCYVMNVADSKKEFFSPSGKDYFYNAFFDNVFLMQSCYQCKFRKGYSNADLRLGDYWGKRYIKNSDGVSSVLIFTEKGAEILDKIESKELPSGDDVFFAQSTENYFEEKFRTDAFGYLKETNSLKQTIKFYRKKFPVKKRIILKSKTILSTLLSPKALSKLKSFRWKIKRG